MTAILEQEIDNSWEEQTELAYRQGTVEEVRDFNQLIAAAIAAGVIIDTLPPRQVPIESVLSSRVYRSKFERVRVRTDIEIKNLTADTIRQVSKQINAGIDAGSTPTEIANEISKRFNVSRSKAKRIAETEINWAYADAKLDAAALVQNETGLKSVVRHISALSPTTRPHHAARHGNLYTIEDQRLWWDTGVNRINCKCSTQTVLVDRNNAVIFELDMVA